MAEQRTFIRYDNRGFGLSQRDATDFSLDAQILDLAAVVDRLSLENFALFGYIFSGQVAIACAARHPERVSHLILWCTSPLDSDWWPPERQQALRRLADADMELYIDTMAHLAFGWSASEQARQYAAALRESTSQETLRALWEAPPADVTDLLPQVKSPTLVLHRRGLRSPNVEVAQSIASRIPAAQLTVLEVESAIPYVGDVEPVLQAIDEFLGEGEEAEAAAEPAAPAGLVTILFTDMESSTALTQRLGDAKAQEILHAHNAIVREALKAYAGSEIKHTGDGIMASFLTTSRALESAVAIQRAVTAHAEEHAGSPLRVRIGLNAGEPVAEEQDLFGSAVQLARRICDDAEPGEILASDVVRQLAAGKGFLFSDRGETALRGFEDPVRLYELRWQP